MAAEAAAEGEVRQDCSSTTVQATEAAAGAGPHSVARLASEAIQGEVRSASTSTIRRSWSSRARSAPARAAQAVTAASAVLAEPVAREARAGRHARRRSAAAATEAVV